MAVQASQGRVTAVAKRTRSDGLQAGRRRLADPHQPRRRCHWLIPGVPEDEGARELVVDQPRSRASHRHGRGARPAGAVRAGRRRDGRASRRRARPRWTSRRAWPVRPATVKLTSDQPVIGAVISSSERAGAQPDSPSSRQQRRWCVPESVPWRRPGPGDSELVLSNGGATDAAAVVRGAQLRRAWCCAPTMCCSDPTAPPPAADLAAPSYLVVKVPDGSACRRRSGAHPARWRRGRPGHHPAHLARCGQPGPAYGAGPAQSGAERVSPRRRRRRPGRSRRRCGR